MDRISTIWSYKFFIISSIFTEFKVKFATSKLGILWMVLHPLAQVLVYALILSNVLLAKLPNIDNTYAFAIYLMAGMLGWSLFAEIFTKMVGVFVDNANTIKKISFPKITLIAIVCGSAMINNLLLLTTVTVVFAFLGHLPTIYMLWLPVLILLVVLFAVSIGLIFGVLNVFIRDISHLSNIILQFWFWLTPVVYTIDIVPQKYNHYLYYNPLTNIILNYQNILVYGKNVDFSLLIYPIGLSLVLAVVAIFMYKKANNQIGDVL